MGKRSRAAVVIINCLLCHSQFLWSVGNSSFSVGDFSDGMTRRECGHFAVLHTETSRNRSARSKGDDDKGKEILIKSFCNHHCAALEKGSQLSAVIKITFTPRQICRAVKSH